MENKYKKWITYKTENAIRTFTGKAFDLKILDPDTICIEDIAHALSNTARFGGHLPQMYSVAQHSIMVALNVSQEHKLAALLHDASEAYIGDMPSPFKKMMPEYKEIETKLMQVIAKKYGFEFPLSTEVKKVDLDMYILECEAFIGNGNILPVIFYEEPMDVEEEFLAMFYKLTKNK